MWYGALEYARYVEFPRHPQEIPKDPMSDIKMVQGDSENRVIVTKEEVGGIEGGKIKGAESENLRVTVRSRESSSEKKTGSSIV